MLKNVSFISDIGTLINSDIAETSGVLRRESNEIREIIITSRGRKAFDLFGSTNYTN
jgi:hypothetical protein